MIGCQVVADWPGTVGLICDLNCLNLFPDDVEVDGDYCIWDCEYFLIACFDMATLKC